MALKLLRELCTTHALRVCCTLLATASMPPSAPHQPHAIFRPPPRTLCRCWPDSYLAAWLPLRRLPRPPQFSQSLPYFPPSPRRSFIKTMRSDPTRVMPDRSFLTMEYIFQAP